MKVSKNLSFFLRFSYRKQKRVKSWGVIIIWGSSGSENSTKFDLDSRILKPMDDRTFIYLWYPVLRNMLITKQAKT